MHAPPGPPEMTVLVADVAGVRTRCAEPAQALVAAVRPSVERNRGTIMGLTGSGLVSTFDSPGRAVRAAGELRAALAPLGIELRIGVHTGVGEGRRGGLAGAAVDIAAGLARAAQPGAILVSPTVTDRVAGSGLTFAAHHEAPDSVPQPPFEVV